MKKYIICLVFLIICEILLALYLSVWREDFYNAIVARNIHDFEIQLGIFTGVALFYCFVNGMAGYMISLSGIRWREILNEKALSKKSPNVSNVNQRIQEDCMMYPDLVINLLSGALKSVGYILVFSAALIMAFSWWYLLVVIGYSLLGTLVTRYVADPLVKLNYDSQQAEATYRNNLINNNFLNCIGIMRQTARKQKHLTYLQSFYSQLGVVLPLILVVGAYFSTNMTVGSLMRFNNTVSTIIDNMSYGVMSFALINKLLSCRKRLKEIDII